MKQNIQKILKENKIYFGLVGLFLILGSILLIFIDHGDVIFFFSDNRTAFGDTFFRLMTQLGEEWPYILALAFFLFVRYSYALLIPVTGIVVALISFSLKRIFLHSRPSIYFEELGRLEELNLIENVTLLSGPTSFPSGHTISAFAIFGVIALMLRQKKIIAVGLFFMALGAALSRVYLVQHFFIDVWFGSFLGSFIALLLFVSVQTFIWRKPNHPLNRSLSDRIFPSKSG